MNPLLKLFHRLKIKVIPKNGLHGSYPSPERQVYKPSEKRGPRRLEDAGERV